MYAAGSALSSRVACEQCFCLRGARHCVRPSCLPPPQHCAPRPATGACCPQRYYCDSSTEKPNQNPNQFGEYCTLTFVIQSHCLLINVFNEPVVPRLPGGRHSGAGRIPGGDARQLLVVLLPARGGAVPGDGLRAGAGRLPAAAGARRLLRAPVRLRPRGRRYSLQAYHTSSPTCCC